MELLKADDRVTVEEAMAIANDIQPFGARRWVELEPLDEEGARKAILAHRERVEAFAISGYFGVRNPAHELRVREPHLPDRTTAGCERGMTG